MEKKNLTSLGKWIVRTSKGLIRYKLRLILGIKFDPKLKPEFLETQTYVFRSSHKIHELIENRKLVKREKIPISK